MTSPVISTIFFDAAGTLFHLTHTVGYHYALVGRGMGLALDPTALEQAFTKAWRKMPMRPATGVPREDDDKDWWRELVGSVLERVSPAMPELDHDAFFETAYSHFAEAGVWSLYPEVIEVLEPLHPRFDLAIVSNFDGRLRMILELLGISKFFRNVCVSSELGADKPTALIYQRALEICGVTAPEVLHVGDDPVRDWEGARAAGLHVFELKRPEVSLRDLLTIL